MTTTKKHTEELLKKLKGKAAKGTAGIAQAKKAVSRKKGRAPAETPASPKPKEKGKGPMGNTVSVYLHTEEQTNITAMRGELLTGEACDANQSTIIRAGLLALRKLSPGAVAGLVESVKALDGRRKD